MAEKLIDSNCTLGEKCKTHGASREFKESLLQVGGENGSLTMGPCDHRTVIKQLVNGGAYGQIYVGELQETGAKVAIKIEKQGTGHEKLLYEGNIYRKLEGEKGIPKVYWFGMHGLQYNMLVMEYLGPSLNDLFEQNEKRFSLKTVLLLINQIYDIFQYVHSLGFVHCDISPSNFVMGVGDKSDEVFLIDFGLSKRIKTPGNFTVNFKRASLKLNQVVVGTPRYVGLHSHRGEEPYYRDDMEALAYVWIYFLKGELPWQGLLATSYVEKLKKIADVKASLSGREICEGIADEFALNVDYCRSLKAHEPPNYHATKKMFQDLAKKQDIQYDGKFDWKTELPEDYAMLRVRCLSVTTPKSLHTQTKIRVPLFAQQSQEEQEMHD